jgi:hypothetical protein
MVIHPQLTDVHRAELVRWREMGLAEFQRRIVRGDEDTRLVEILATFDAYIERCRSMLGHDQIPIATWETWQMAKRRLVEIGQATQGKA